MIINQEGNGFPSIVEVKDNEISSLSVINQEGNELSSSEMKDDEISSLSVINQGDNELFSSEMKDDDISSFRERRIKRRIAFSPGKLKKGRRTVSFY